MPTTVIIGAGVSGLQTAAAFLRIGHVVVVLERQEDVGGVWLNYTAFSVQVPRHFFSLPDFPAPPELDLEEYPSGRSLLRYIIAYAHKNDLYRHIVFRAKVTRLHRLGGSWQCFYSLEGSAVQHRMIADFVVVCTGLHSTPNIPPVESAHLFAGRILHVQDLPDTADQLADQVAGCRVVVVGGSKTAVDTATRLGSAGATEITVVYRKAHWPMSRYPLGGKSRLHFTRLLHSRLAATMAGPYYTASLWGRARGAITKPLRRLFWRYIERRLVVQHGLAGNLMPSMHLEQDLLSGGIVHDGKWTELLATGEVVAIKGEPQRYTHDGLVLRGGGFLEADVVVYATGHRKDYAFIDADISSKLGLQRDGLYLYRHVLPPLVRNIAFVGAEANSLNNPLTAFLQAEWLVSCLQGRVKLPSPQVMMRDLQRKIRWQRQKLPPQPDRASMLGIFVHRYHDQLLQDMGLSPRRKSSPWRECFEAYTAADYREAVQQLRVTPLTDASRQDDPSQLPYGVAADSLGPLHAAGGGSGLRQRSGATSSPARHSVDDDAFVAGGAVGRMTPTRIRISAAAAAAVAPDVYDMGNGEMSVGFGLTPAYGRSGSRARHLPGERGPSLDGTGGGSGGRVSRRISLGLVGEEGVRPSRASASSSGAATHGHPHAATDSGAFGGGRLSGSAAGLGQRALAAAAAFVGRSSRSGGKPGGGSGSGGARSGQHVHPVQANRAQPGAARAHRSLDGSIALDGSPGLPRPHAPSSHRASTTAYLGVAGGTPPDTPTTAATVPYLYPYSYMALAVGARGAPGVYVPPASGRSCLMDAAELAMVDGVVGGALRDREQDKDKEKEKETDKPSAGAGADSGSVAAGQGEAGPRARSQVGDAGARGAGGSAKGASRFGPAAGAEARQQQQQPRGVQPGDGHAGAPGSNEAAAGRQGASAVAWGEELQERTSAFGRPSARPVAVAAAGARPALGDTGAFGSFQVLAGSDPARAGSVAAVALAAGPASAPVPHMYPGQSRGEDEDGHGEGVQRRRSLTAAEDLHDEPALVPGAFIPWVAPLRGAPPPPSGADTGAYIVIPDEDGDVPPAAVSPAAPAEPGSAAMPFALASPFMTLAHHQHTNGSDGPAQQPQAAPPAAGDAAAAAVAHPGKRLPSSLRPPGQVSNGAALTVPLTPAAAEAAATAAAAFHHQRRSSAGAVPHEDPQQQSGGTRSSSASAQHLHVTAALCTAAAAVAARRDSNCSSTTSVGGLSNPGGEGSSRIPSTSTDPLATGGSRSGKPRPLVQLVAMRQAGGGGNNANLPDSPAAANGGGGGNGSVGIMGSSQGLSLRTGGLERAHDSSDMDFVGTPPSCFAGPLSELQRDQAGGLDSGIGDAESSISTDDFASYSEDPGPLSGVGAQGRRVSLTGAHQGRHPAYYRPAATTYGQVGSGGPVAAEDASAQLRKLGLGLGSVVMSDDGTGPGALDMGMREDGAAAGKAPHEREPLDHRQREQGGEGGLPAGGAAADSRAAWDFGRRGAVHPRGRASMSVMQGSAGGAGLASGGENGGRASLALERYAARMTAAPAFRMSMTNMADMAPQALKHSVAARASAIAAATHGSMPGSSLHTSMHSAPINALFLNASASAATAGPGGGGGSGIHLGALASAQRTDHQTYSHNARMPGRMARMPDPYGPADLDTGGDSYCVVPGLGLITIEDNETGGQEVTSGNVGRSGEVSTTARSGPLSETSRSRSGPMGSPAAADGGVAAVGGGGLMLKGPGVRQVQQQAQRQAALAKSPSAGRGPAAMSPFSRMTAAVGMVVLRQAGGSNGSGGGGGGGDDSPASGHAAGGAHGSASPSRVSVNGAGGGSAGPGVPPGSSSSGAGGGAAAGGGSWDLTFKQLSRAVVAPPQRGPGVIRAAMISKRSLLQSNSNTSDRPSESGAATPTGGSFFSARRALGAGGLDDGAASGTASPGTPIGAPGGGVGATSRGGVGALSSGTASPLGAADRLLVQPSGPAVVPIRETSRFLVRSNSSKNRMQNAAQGAYGVDGTAGSVHGAAAALTASGGSGENGGADAAAAGAARGGGGGGGGGASSGSLGGVLAPGGRETNMTTSSRMNWNSRLQSEGTKSAMQAVIDAATARRASLHYANPPPSQLESPLFAKLVAASQSHTGIVQGQPGQMQAADADAEQPGAKLAKRHVLSPLRPAFRSGEVPVSDNNQALGYTGRGARVAGSVGAAAATAPLSSDPLIPVRMASGADAGGLYGSGHGRGLRHSSGVIAPELATLGPSALAVTAAAAAATTSTVSAVASTGGGGGSGWDGGAMAKSFKRLSGMLLPGVASGGGPTLGVAGSRRNSLDVQRNGDAGGAGAAGDGTGGGGGGGGTVRFLKRMVSGKRRSVDGPVLPGWSSSTGGSANPGAAAGATAAAPALGVIGTVDEGMEGGVELPPPPSPLPYGEGGLGAVAAVAAAVPHAAGGGGGGLALHAFPSNGGSVRERVSDAREPYDLELPPAALAAAVLGRSVSRRHSTQHPY